MGRMVKVTPDITFGLFEPPDVEDLTYEDKEHYELFSSVSHIYDCSIRGLGISLRRSRLAR